MPSGGSRSAGAAPARTPSRPTQHYNSMGWPGGGAGWHRPSVSEQI